MIIFGRELLKRLKSIEETLGLVWKKRDFRNEWGDDHERLDNGHMKAVNKRLKELEEKVFTGKEKKEHHFND